MPAEELFKIARKWKEHKLNHPDIRMFEDELFFSLGEEIKEKNLQDDFIAAFKFVEDREDGEAIDDLVYAYEASMFGKKHAENMKLSFECSCMIECCNCLVKESAYLNDAYSCYIFQPMYWDMNFGDYLYYDDYFVPYLRKGGPFVFFGDNFW